MGWPGEAWAAGTVFGISTLLRQIKRLCFPCLWLTECLQTLKEVLVSSQSDPRMKVLTLCSHTGHSADVGQSCAKSNFSVYLLKMQRSLVRIISVFNRTRSESEITFISASFKVLDEFKKKELN